MELIVISLAPVFIIAIYIYLRDKYEKEPLRLILFSILAGAFIVIPVVFTEEFLMKFLPQQNLYSEAFYHAFIVAALTEEVFKFLALYYLIWRNREFNEKFDGIVYGVFISLGFAWHL